MIIKILFWILSMMVCQVVKAPKKFLDAIGPNFKELNKAKSGNLLNSFPNARNDNTAGIQITF